MEKIRLELDALEVDTFAAEPGAEDAAPGTVRGHSDVCTAWGDVTCRFFGSCDPWMECDGTVVENTCPHVGDC